MNKIQKALLRLTVKEREWIRNILERLAVNDVEGMDIRKLKGYDDIFRIRKGNIRIIYRMSGGRIFILSIERRKDDTYHI